MLTYFVANKAARSFYDKLGFEIDGTSPEARILRGKMFTPDYAIMSKVIRNSSSQDVNGLHAVV